MSNYKADYERWLSCDLLSEEEKQELLSIKDNETEIEERFYRELEFGTGGLRGILGMGKNRMNIYNVRRASQGVAKYLKDSGTADKGVLIGYDTRNFSHTFAQETAKVLAANGVKAYLFDKVHAVPQVSFGIRYLGTGAGVMITASHNPKEYNGFKGYGPDGGQFPPEAADIVLEAINNYDIFNDVKVMDFEEAKQKGLIEMVGSDFDEAYLETIKKEQVNPDVIPQVADEMKLVYTPLHGSGARPVKEILKRVGFKNVFVVAEQDNEDGNFPTVKSPNPENAEGFTIAIELAKKNDVDLIIGTDPDCDRVGIVVRDASGAYRTLTGNQTGALLVEYILEAKKERGQLPANGVVVKTIVTTELATKIAEAYGIATVSLLTGFKYIGEKMTEYGKTGEYSYLIGFEESYGYLVGDYARDKDGVVATMLIAEMAAYYRTKGMNLYEALQNIYKKYGYFYESLSNFTMPGKDGMEKMSKMLSDLRATPITKLAGLEVVKVIDYLEDGTGLPKSNVLKYELSDGKTYFFIRPSGTEPKVKLYVGTSADSMENAVALADSVTKEVKAFLGV